jgi:hypothetical protein
MQKFPESLKAYNEYLPSMKDTYKPILDMAKTYGEQRPLSPEALITFLSRMKNGHNPMFALRLLYYDAKLRNNWEEHAKLAHFVLKLWNPDWHNDHLTYLPESKTLILEGSGLSQLSSHHTANSLTRNWDLHVNLIGSMPIEKLSLSETDYYDFASLKELPISWIDISHTSINQLHQMDQFQHLKTLVIHERQFSAKQLKSISKHINGIEIKYKKNIESYK